MLSAKIMPLTGSAAKYLSISSSRNTVITVLVSQSFKKVSIKRKMSTTWQPREKTREVTLVACLI